jgi:hypothetical protein
MKLGLLLAFLTAATLLSACAAQTTPPVATIGPDGLREVRSKAFDTALVRPDVDFGRYREVLINRAELAFVTPDRSKRQFPLSEQQKERFRELLDAKFAAELASSKTLQVAAVPGPVALELHVRVQDIIATVPPRAVGRGWGGIALEALGEATLVIELRDSESEEILARVFNRRTVDGIAVAQKQGTPITRWEDIETVCARWAALVRERLDAIVSEQY